MVVYPEIESWNEFYPSDIFVALSNGEVVSAAINEFVKANIGANIIIGKNATESKTYKKVGEIKSVADIASNLVLLGTTDASSAN